MPEDTRLRIGELSRRSGVSPELLRAWERRYGLLRPTRSTGGLRLYSLDDLERVRSMRQHLGRGVAAAEAAALVADTARVDAARPSLSAEAARTDLREALDEFDEARAHEVIDELLAAWGLDTFLTDVVLPYLDDLGERWQRGEASVAQEHFASAILRGRLLGLARGWGRGLGPLALLACAPGEQHELGLIAFGLALRSRGWRIAYLGGDTPADTLARAADLLEPDFVVVSAAAEERMRAAVPQFLKLARKHSLAVGGRGGEAVRSSGRVTVLDDGPGAAADQLTRLLEREQAR